MREPTSPAADAHARRDGQRVPLASVGRAIGRTRFVVLLAVVAVILVAVSLFLLGTVLAVISLWKAWSGVLSGNLGGTNLTVELLEVVTMMLKAVVFYLIGVGLYSLFIAPLSVTVALGVETLNDLETKVISVVIVIMAVTFLEHFIRWEQPAETFRHGATLAFVVAALVLFQFYNHRAREDQMAHYGKTQARAQQEMFERDHEHLEVKPEEVAADKAVDDRSR